MQYWYIVSLDGRILGTFKSEAEAKKYHSQYLKRFGTCYIGGPRKVAGT